MCDFQFDFEHMLTCFPTLEFRYGVHTVSLFKENRSFLDAEYVKNVNLRDVPLIGKLKTDHEVGTEKRERGKNEAHAIGASRQITAFPLLGLEEKVDQKATSRVYHVNRTFSLKLLRGPMFTLGHGGHT